MHYIMPLIVMILLFLDAFKLDMHYLNKYSSWQLGKYLDGFLVNKWKKLLCWSPRRLACTFLPLLLFARTYCSSEWWIPILYSWAHPIRVQFTCRKPQKFQLLLDTGNFMASVIRSVGSHSFKLGYSQFSVISNSTPFPSELPLSHLL